MRVGWAGKCTLAVNSSTEAECLSRGTNQVALVHCSMVLDMKRITGTVHVRVVVLMRYDEGSEMWTLLNIRLNTKSNTVRWEKTTQNGLV